MKKKYDIVSIGDCAIDAFLKVEEAKVLKEKNDHKLLAFSFGDKIPYEELDLISAGNCNNVAVGSSRLGLKAAFYGSVGHDHNSHVILNKLHEEKVSTEFMSIQKGMQTNFHVVLWHGGERTILIKHQPFKYKLPAGIDNTNWIYLSSIGPRGLTVQPPLLALLKRHPEVKLAFNPGTFQLRMGVKKLAPLFKVTEILFVNKEEAELLVGYNGGDVHKMALALQKMGPHIVVITDGLNGSYALSGHEFWQCGIYPHKPIEATGAGDAFATGFTAATFHGLPVAEALRWGARNGASVATKVGPQAGLVQKNAMVHDLGAHKGFKAKLVSK